MFEYFSMKTQLYHQTDIIGVKLVRLILLKSKDEHRNFVSFVNSHAIYQNHKKRSPNKF